MHPIVVIVVIYLLYNNNNSSSNNNKAYCNKRVPALYGTALHMMLATCAVHECQP
jgi:hypothetical protein